MTHPALNEVLRLHRVSRAQSKRITELTEALRAALKHVDDDMNNRPVCLWKLREILVAAIDGE